MVHVRLSPHRARERLAVSWLDDQERLRWERYRYLGPRRRFGLTRAALRAILAGQLGCEIDEITFDTTDRGKPVALTGGTPASISFNVSHSGANGLIAHAPAGRLGVDVEERRPPRNLDMLIDSVLDDQERSACALLPDPHKTDMFLRLWTIKEAIIKAMGIGHALDVSKVRAPAALLHGADSGMFRSDEPHHGVWQLECLGDDRFAAALAYEIPG